MTAETSEEIRILIFEDSIDECLKIERELRRANFSFALKQVDSKSAFERALTSFAPDLILCDFALPSFDGVSALLLTQKVRPETPFVLFSWDVGHDLVLEILKCGATDFIYKNRLDYLTPTVRRILAILDERSKRRRTEELLQESLAERRRAEDQLRDLQRKMAELDHLAELGRRAVKVSHEISNSLTGILNLVEVIQAGAGNDTEIELIVQETGSAIKLVESIIQHAAPPLPDALN